MRCVAVRPRLSALVGKPGGILVRARCGALGHKWEVCDEVCCDGRVAWCVRCTALVQLDGVA